MGRNAPRRPLSEWEMVSRLERPVSGIGPEEIGLTLDEGKAVLQKV